MSLLSGWMADVHLDAVVEIAPGWVTVATGQGSRVTGAAGGPLPMDAVVPSLTGTNVRDRDAVRTALQSAFDTLGVRPRRVALVVPDLTARVSLVPFAQVPARREDLEQLIRWQVRKSAPFPIDEAVLGYAEADAGSGGRTFAVTLARQAVVQEYEDLCVALGAQPGLVDIATLAAINVVLGTGRAGAGDWLVVHLRPEYTSLAIMRGESLQFFRTRATGEDEPVEDLVHQTVMYYQDRLHGEGFSQVFLGGRGRDAGTLEAAREGLAERLGVGVAALDASAAEGLPDGLRRQPALIEVAGPVAGMLLRAESEPVGV